LIALRHEEPDRVPIDFGARHSIHISAHRALKRHLGLDDGADTVRSYLNNSAEPDSRLLTRFATDVIAFQGGSGDRYVFRLDPETNSYTDEWGITMRMPPGGYYYDPIGYPLAAAQTVAEVEHYHFPDPADPHRLAGILTPIRIASAAREMIVICFSRAARQNPHPGPAIRGRAPAPVSQTITLTMM